MSWEVPYDYKCFRSTIAQKKIVVSNDVNDIWTIFDAGPRSVKYPILFLPPCSGTADIFYKLLMALSSKGIRAISVNYPVLWNIENWCLSFSRLLEKLNIYQIHIFGASLGGFLAQKFAEYSNSKTSKVLSLILCNSFTDTSIFKLTYQSKLFWMMPRYVLENHVLAGLVVGSDDIEVQEATRFVKRKIGQLSQSELASRLTLNCANDIVDPKFLQNLPITIIDVCDPNALTTSVNFNVIKCYPNAKRAHMKSGGNFPYISRTNEVTMFIQIHLKTFDDTPFMPRDADHPTNYQIDNIDLSEVGIDVLDMNTIAC